MAAAPWIVLTYQTPHGRQPATEYVHALEGAEFEAAVALIKALQERGNELKEPTSKALGGNLFEVRDVPTGVRIFYTFLSGRRAVLLDGFTKKRQDIPADALKRIRAMAKEMREAEEQKTASPKKHSRKPKRSR